MTWKLWALGSNGNGQLAVGHIDDVDTPTACLFDPSEHDANPLTRPKKIVAGGNHTILLYEDGSVYAAGLNDDGRCGIEPVSDPITAFRRVTFTVPGGSPQARRLISHFDDVTATWSATIFVTTNPTTKLQEIYSCGIGDHGELGQGSEITVSQQPGLVMSSAETVCVNLTSSFRHVVMIQSNGIVLGWGNGRKGQLGTNTPSASSARAAGSIWTPSTVVDLARGKTGAADFHLACGKDFTCIISSVGSHNSDREKCVSRFLGLETIKDDKHGIRKQVPAGPCKELHANWNTLHAVDGAGAWHSVGRNDKGQILPNRLKINVLSNIKAGSEHSIAQISVPGILQNNMTSDSTMVEQHVVLWGWGEHGNIGPLEPGKPWLSRQCSPSRTYMIIGLQGVKLEALGAGCASTFLMADLDEQVAASASLTLTYMAFPRDCDLLCTDRDQEAGEQYDPEDQLQSYWQTWSQTKLPNAP